MIAARRERRRPLIRSNARAAAITRGLSQKDGMPAFQNGSYAEFGHVPSVFPYTQAAIQPELIAYLRQLSGLHAAGILTDDEFFAARGRLIGS